MNDLNSLKNISYDTVELEATRWKSCRLIPDVDMIQAQNLVLESYRDRINQGLMYELTATVLAETKKDNIKVSFTNLEFDSWFDHMKFDIFMIMEKYWFIPEKMKNKLWWDIKYRKTVNIRNVDITQYILYPSLPATGASTQRVYKMRYDIRDDVRINENETRGIR
jgi:hypothetical protein